jgi:hypothetical protein
VVIDRDTKQLERLVVAAALQNLCHETLDPPASTRSRPIEEDQAQTDGG